MDASSRPPSRPPAFLPLDKLAAFGVINVFALFLLIQWRLDKRIARSRDNLAARLGPGATTKSRPLVLGFFHPFCNAGGGGELVLWTAVSHMQRVSPKTVCAIYTGDWPTASKDQILDKAMTRFDISLSPDTILFVPLPSRRLISDSYWKRFTLIGQAMGSIVVAWEAFVGKEGIAPDIYFDTMGFAFTFFVVKFVLGWFTPIGAYVHYPTISTDMLERVKSRKATHTNVAVAGSWWRSALKLRYYRAFAFVYTLALRLADVTFANSTWTKAHLDGLLNRGSKGKAALALAAERGNSQTSILYPPSDTSKLGKIPIADADRGRVIMSLAQFRPEKDHPAQLRALAALFELRPGWKIGPVEDRVKLVLVGSSRDAADEARVDALRKLALELGLQDHIEFVVNAPYHVVLDWLGKASIGLATMVDEHFGINVVEFMAGGLVPLSHASAGPLLDIIVPFDGEPTGFHALDPTGFAEKMALIFEMPSRERTAMRERARASVAIRFGRPQFERGWEEGWAQLVAKFQKSRREASRVE